MLWLLVLNYEKIVLGNFARKRLDCEMRGAKVKKIILITKKALAFVATVYRSTRYLHKNIVHIGLYRSSSVIHFDKLVY